MEYKIVLDSCGELTPEMKATGIFESVALSMQVGEETIVDDAGFDQADFLKKVYNAYLQIQEWLIETGDTFCCIVPENEKLSELDLMVNIKSVHRYRLQSPLFVGADCPKTKLGSHPQT